MEPYNDGVTDHSKTAPGEDTHVKTQGDDAQVDDNGIDVGEVRTRFARPANPDRSRPQWTPLDSIDDTNTPIEDRKAYHQAN
ncbi:unnamed protein product, partial [Heligmosomoides polygyrus]|uniref:ELM2 domain-containing protein n=1 Tax=Heligmosomoides polygyrus TaxID=6339 RepID=A0A183GEZ8_HELPZ